VKGRKRHMATDTLGIMMDVSVTPANVHDTKGAMRTLGKIARREKQDQIQIVFADKGYQGQILQTWVKKNLGAEMRIGNNRTTPNGFVPDKKRWVIERSFSWLEDYNRLSKDRERLPATSVALVRIAFIRVMLRRLDPSEKVEWVAK
jgi:putative transposase